MTISELIAKLQSLQAKHGDLVVALENAEIMLHDLNFKVQLGYRADEMEGPHEADPNLPDIFISITPH